MRIVARHISTSLPSWPISGVLLGILCTLVLVLGSTAFASPIITRPSDAIRIKPSPAGDQEIIALGPPRSVVAGRPGESKELEFTISNRTRSPEQIKLTAELLQAPSGSNSFAQIVPNPPSTEAHSWIKLPTDQLNLDQEQQAQITVVIAVPPDARPGVHAAAVVADTFSSSPSVNTDETARVGLTSRLVGQIVIEVAGKQTPKFKVTGLVSDRLVWPAEKLDLGINVENRGNTLGDITAKITVANLTGKNVFATELPESQLLPDGNRKLSQRWNQRPWIGWYRPVATVDTGSGKPVTVELPRIFLLPSWWVLALLGIAVVLPTARYVVVRSRRKRTDRNSSAQSGHP